VLPPTSAEPASAAPMVQDALLDLILEGFCLLKGVEAPLRQLAFATRTDP
jgi:hypothetical protein